MGKNPSQNFDSGRFSSPIRSDKTHAFPGVHFEGDVAYGLDRLVFGSSDGTQAATQTSGFSLCLEGFAQVIDLDDRHALILSQDMVV